MGYRKQNPLTADGVLIADAGKVTSSTSAGTAAQVLTSNGPGVAPTYQAVSASGAITTVTGNSGGAESPLAGNFNVLGTGSITVAGSANTETVQLTGLTNHAVLVGAGTATITKVGPTSTTGQVLQSAGASADPAFSTATYPLTTTANQLLYSSATNTVSGLATANRAVITTNSTGVPVATALATDGQLIIGSTAGAPAAASLTAGTGISITPGSNSITIAVSGSVVGETITGDTGGALSPTAGNWNIITNSNAGQTVSFSGASSTLTLNVSDGNNNTFVGSNSGQSGVSGGNNTGFGTQSVTSITTATNCTGVGYLSLAAVTTGGSNSGFGEASLDAVTTGTNNCAFGQGAGSQYTSSESSNIVIGNIGTTAESNVMRLGTQGSSTGQQNKCFIAGIVGVTPSNPTPVLLNSSTGQLGNVTSANSAILATNSSGTYAMRAFSVVKQVFTSTGTYTPTSGMLYCEVICVGGGGAGGGAATTGATTASAGTGGGEGEYAVGVFSAATIGASKAVTIGAGGTGVSGTTGNTGGTSSLGTLITAIGGTGGTTVAAAAAGSASGGAGGTGGTVASFSSPGNRGGTTFFSVAAGTGYAGAGSPGRFGEGGDGGAVNANGNAAVAYGTGGAGAFNFINQAAARTGGAGADGLIVVTEYVIA